MWSPRSGGPGAKVKGGIDWPAVARRLRAGLLSIEGTNCDEELAVALRGVGIAPSLILLHELERSPSARSGALDGFDLLFVPGGFSGGDYVRAGAIFAARLRAAVGEELQRYVAEGRLLGGICNGFQVLIELGLLPGRADGRLGPPEAALMANASGHFECRPTFVAWAGGRFGPLEGRPSGERYLFPSAHAEGRLLLAEPSAERLDELERAGQVLFRWINPNGGPAAYPWNPNGSAGDIAGLTNPSGNVFGLMPHPERAFFRAQHPAWTRTGSAEGYGDGRRFFEALARWAESRR